MEELKNIFRLAIIEKFGEISERGCYSEKCWMSTQAFFDLVCDMIENYDLGED